MKNIFLVFILYYSISVSAQIPERCELSYDTIGYCLNGQMVIYYQYKQGTEFSGDAAAVMNYDNKWELINEKGKAIMSYIYDGLAPCYNFPGWFACKLGNKVGIINDKGKEVIPIKYEVDNFELDFNIDGGQAYFDSTYYFVFKENGKYGLLDCFGKQKCDFKYDKIWVNYNWIKGKLTTSEFIVKSNHKIQFMHPNGAIDSKLNYDAFLGYWGHDCVLRKGKQIEFFDGETWQINKTHVEKEDQASGPLFEANENDKKGLIDSMGKILVPFIYQNVYPLVWANDLNSTYIFVKDNNKVGIIDGHGKGIIPLQYDEINLICISNNKMLKVKQNEKWAMFDLGKKMSEFIYDDMNCQSENSAYIEIGDRNGELFFDGREVYK